MIKIIYRPIRFEIKDSQSFEYPFDRNNSLKHYLDLIAIDYKDHDVILEGKSIENLNRPLDNGDEVIVTPKVKLEAIGAFLYTAFVTHWFTTTVFLLTTAYSVYAAITARKSLPNFGLSGGGLDENSPTYGWEGIRTVQEVGIPVKIIYGEHRTGGNIINQYIFTDGDKQYLNLLIGIGEGEIESISDIKINELPSANFDGIDLDYRYGTNSQTVIPNFADLHNVYNVGANLTKNNPYTYTTVDSDVEAFEVNLTFPNGMFQVDSSGNITAWAVTYKVEYKVHTDPGYIDLGSTTIDAKSRTAIRRVFRKTGLTPEQYDIKITKTSDDSSLGPPQQEGDLTLTSIDEIKTDDLSYPNTALLSIRALATDQLNGSTPNITFVVKGKKVNIPIIKESPTGNEVDWENYYWDDTTSKWRLLSDDTELYWDGVTYGDRWCANPIWCLKDLQTNTRYGAGEFILTTDLDADELLEMAKICETKVSDGAGGYEKRFRLDIVIDSASKLPDLLSQVCATFRAFSFYSNNGFSFRIDMAEDPVQIFGMGNIIKNQFSQSWKSRTDIYNLIEAQINDIETDYKDETVSYADQASLIAGDPIKKKNIRLFMAHKSYAIREARYALWISKYINRTVNIRCGIDAVVCKAGDVVGVSHDVPQWGYSGRVITGSTTTSINIDRGLIISAGITYHILIRFADDTIEERTVTNAPATYPYTTIIVSVAFTNAPEAYDVFALGEVNKVVKPFRVVSISRGNEGEVNLTALEYDANVYDDDAVIIPTNNYSALSNYLDPVENLDLTEAVIIMNDGSVESAIDVWFTKPVFTGTTLKVYDRARIYLSDNGGASYEFRGECKEEYFRIQGGLTTGINYKVLVASVSKEGEELAFSSCPTDTLTLVGKDSSPANVSNFAYTFTNEVVFTWDKNTDKDLAGYEIRDEDANWGVQSSHLIYHGLANTWTIVSPASRTPGTYYIKAFDTSGNYSDTAANVTPTNTAPAAPTLTTTQWFGFAKIEWTDSADVDIRGYNVYKSSTNAWGGEEFLESKVTGSEVIVQGNAPVDAIADSANATSITDADLIGMGVNYFVGDIILQTSGTYKDQTTTVTAFNNSTGQVSVSSWPSGTPDIGDAFVIKDRAYYKVCGVDTYGEGSLSSAATIDFTPLSEAEIGDAVISARKFVAGEIITLSAQIKDAIITNAKIYDLDGSKITADSITADKYNELRNTYVYTSDDSLDASFSFEVPFKIVSEMTSIVSIKLSFKIYEFRAYATTVPAGGGHTTPSGGGHTTPSGGGSTTPSGGGSTSGSDSNSHYHTLTVNDSSGGNRVYLNGQQLGVSGGGSVTTSSAEGHTHTVTLANSTSGTALASASGPFSGAGGGNFITSTDSGHSHIFVLNGQTGGALNYSGGAFYSSGYPGTYYSSVSTPDHTHTTPNHQHSVSDHTHTVSDHQHTVSDHAHSLTYGIFEDSQSPTIHYHIDNGGGYGGASANYTSDQTDLDITSAISGVGWKAIRFDTNARCRIFAIIECKLDISA